MKKRIIVILTCIMMVVAFMPAVTFAASNPAMKYVALGDASTAGYGMADTVGYNKVAAGSYPALVRDEFKARNYTVSTPFQLAMSKMRVEDLLYILNDSEGDAYYKEKFVNTGIITPEMKKQFKTSIKNADVITYSLGTVNVGEYFRCIAKDVDKYCADEEINKMVETDPDHVRADFDKAVDEAIDKIPSEVLDYIIDDINANRTKYVKAAAYAYYSFSTSYDETIEIIKSLNKNRDKANIIVLGVRNMLKDLEIDLKILKYTINFKIGKLYGENLVEKVNDHLKNAAGVKFIATGNVKTFLDEVSNYSNVDPGKDRANYLSAQFKRFCDTLEDDLQLGGDVESYVNKNYSSGVKERIARGKKFAYDTAAACLENVANSKKITINLSYLTLTDLMKFKDESYKKEVFDEILNAGEPLMAGLKDKCIDNAKKIIRNKDSGSTIRRDLNNNFLNNGKIYITDNYCSFTDKYPDNGTGRTIMAAGLRSEMGKGFFLHPSAAGHKQIKNLIINYLCPVKTSITKLTPAKKAFTVKWSKKANINGYQIRYSLKSGMGSAKTVNIANKATVSKKITKLKAKKKYYVQVRTYKTTNGKKYFSAWSVKESVKTK